MNRALHGQEFASDIRHKRSHFLVVKETVRTTAEMCVEEGYKFIRSGRLKNYPKVLHSEDATEGPLAFSEGRDPVWCDK